MAEEYIDEVRITGDATELRAEIEALEGQLKSFQAQLDSLGEHMAAAGSIARASFESVLSEIQGQAVATQAAIADLQAQLAAQTVTMGNAGVPYQDIINKSVGLDRSMISARQSAKAFEAALATQGVAAGENAVAMENMGSAVRTLTAAQFGGLVPQLAGVNKVMLDAEGSAQVFIEQEKNAAAAVGEFAVGLGNTGLVIRDVEGATKGLNFATAGMTQEYVRMTRAIATGQFERLPSELITAASRMGGLQYASLGAIAGVVALAGGIAYLIYEGFEARKELDLLTRSFADTGRGASVSRGYLEEELTELRQMPRVTSAAAEALLGLEARHADMSAQLTNQVNQLMPMFVDLYGKQAPEAAIKMTQALQDLTTAGLKQLDQEYLNLSPKQYEHIRNLIETGHQAEAVNLIMKQLSEQTGIYIKTLGDQVYDDEQKMASLRAEIERVHAVAASPGHPGTYKFLIDELKQVEDHLKHIRDLEADQGKAEAGTSLKRDLDQAGTLGTNRITELRAELKRFQQDESNPQATQEMRDKFKEAAKEIQYQIDQLQQKMDFRGTGFHDAGQKLIAKNKEAISEINEDTKLGLNEREAAIRSHFQAVLDSHKLNKAEEIRVQTDENNELATIAKKRDTEANEDARNTLDADIRIARLQYEQRKNELDAEVAAHQISKEEEIAQLAAALDRMQKMEIKSLNLSVAGYAADTVAYKKAQDDKRVVAEQYAEEIAALQKKYALEGANAYATADRIIFSAEDTLVRDIISSRKTGAQIVESIVVDIMEKEISADLRAMTQHLLFNNTKLAADRTTEQGGFIWHQLFETEKTASTATGVTTRATIEATGGSGLIGHIATWVGQWLGFETAKTGATIAGTTARTSVEEAAAVAGQVTATTQNISSVIADAAVAAAGAYAATAMIPYVGPVLAPAAAAEAEGAVLAFLPQASLATGTMEVPHDMPAFLHKGEAVVPRDFATGIKNTLSSSHGLVGFDLSAFSGDENSSPFYFQPTIHAQQNTDLGEILDKQGKTMLTWMQLRWRDGSMKQVFNGMSRR